MAKADRLLMCFTVAVKAFPPAPGQTPASPRAPEHLAGRGESRVDWALGRGNCESRTPPLEDAEEPTEPGKWTPAPPGSPGQRAPPARPLRHLAGPLLHLFRGRLPSVPAELPGAGQSLRNKNSPPAPRTTQHSVLGVCSGQKAWDPLLRHLPQVWVVANPDGSPSQARPHLSDRLPASTTCSHLSHLQPGLWQWLPKSPPSRLAPTLNTAASKILLNRGRIPTFLPPVQKWLPPPSKEKPEP